MLIIYAHPNKNGHSGKILEQIIEKLKEKKEEYEILDLYKIKYDPVLKHNEHYTSGNYNISSGNEDVQIKIKQHDKLIFIYPTWWNSPPAILKGFIDRIFTPRFAFVYEGKLPKGLLKDKKALVFTSTGAPRLLTRFYYKDGSIKFLTRDVLKFCGIQAKSFVIDRAIKLNDKQVCKITKAVERGLKYLN